MNWEKIVEYIPEVVNEIKNDYVIQNTIIKDGIFGILEEHCNVIYYPLEDEKNRGFNVQKFMNDKPEEFVFINTGKTLPKQIFAAAHELGHVWNVAEKVWKKAGEEGKFTEEQEELIVNRFAAELLMPEQEFRVIFLKHFKEIEKEKLDFIDLVRVITMQMNDFMAPYEAVRRRLIETRLINEAMGEFLKDNTELAHKLIAIFIKEQNTMLDQVTKKKAIPKLRDYLLEAESSEKKNIYIINKIKKEFDIDTTIDTKEGKIDSNWKFEEELIKQIELSLSHDSINKEQKDN